MFNQIFKKQKDADQDYKKRVVDRATLIIGIMVKENIPVGEMIDTLQTIQNHLQFRQMRTSTRNLFGDDIKKEAE